MGRVEQLMQMAYDAHVSDDVEDFAKLRTALAACVAEWRTISEAPRDGRALLLCRAGHVMPFTGYWSQPDLSWVDTDGSMRDPTHYQPLPTPPTEGQTQ